MAVAFKEDASFKGKVYIMFDVAILNADSSFWDLAKAVFRVGLTSNFDKRIYTHKTSAEPKASELAKLVGVSKDI